MRTCRSSNQLPQPVKLLIEVVQIAEHAARHEVALHVLHSRLDLALGLRPIGAAQPRFEPPMLGEGVEGGVPHRVTVLGAEHDGAHAVVQQLGAAPAEVRERVLVSSQERGEPLMLEAFHVGAPRVAERHHEDVNPGDFPAQPHRHLAPVDLHLPGTAAMPNSPASF